MKPRIALVGPGRLGQAVTALLRQAGYPISAIVGRNADTTRQAAEFIGAEFMATEDLHRCRAAEIILVAVTDDQLAAVGGQLLRSLDDDRERIVLHFSGRHPAAILHSELDARSDRCHLLSLHPLQTFATPQQGCRSLPGCYAALEGDAVAHDSGHQLAKDLGLHSFILQPQHKTLYHAAACMASNFVTSLFNDASSLMGDCLKDPQLAAEALKPLLLTAAANTAQLGAQQALTGPIVRGDQATVASHLQQLDQQQPQLAALYRQLGQRTLKLASDSGRLTPDQATALKQLLYRPN